MSAKERERYMAYPPAEKIRCGCKVSWHTYATKAEAEACAEAARHNARIDSALGYDFGYCCPGSIGENRDGTFTVCIP